MGQGGGQASMMPGELSPTPPPLGVVTEEISESVQVRERQNQESHPLGPLLRQESFSRSTLHGCEPGSPGKDELVMKHGTECPGGG